MIDFVTVIIKLLAYCEGGDGGEEGRYIICNTKQRTTFSLIETRLATRRAETTRQTLNATSTVEDEKTSDGNDPGREPFETWENGTGGAEESERPLICYNASAFLSA